MSESTMTITMEVSQALREAFLRHMAYRSILKDLHPKINPADAILLLVTKAIIDTEEET